MEFLQSEIARLVLGYLKQEKCDEAYETFLNTSDHLKECCQRAKRGGSFTTEIMGKTLLDVLDDYCKMTAMVQEQLQKFNKNDGSKSNIHVVDQLQSIFDLMESSPNPQTMLLRVTLPGSSTRSNRFQSKAKRTAVAHVAINENEGSADDELDGSQDNVEATSLRSLPGYASNESPRRRKSGKKISPDHIKENQDPRVDLDLETVQQAFLDNKMHEKIADHINKVFNTPESNEMSSSAIQEADKSVTGSSNIDELNSIIKTIVDQTECDPLFTKMLDGIVADAAVAAEEPISEESDSRLNSWSETSTPQRPSSLTRDSVHSRRRISLNTRSLPELRNKSRKELIQKQGLRSCQKKDNLLENQNAEAIQSIIEATQQPTEPAPAEPEPIPPPIAPTNYVVVQQPQEASNLVLIQPKVVYQQPQYQIKMAATQPDIIQMPMIMVREPFNEVPQKRYRHILPNYPRPNYEYSISLAPGYEGLLNPTEPVPVSISSSAPVKQIHEADSNTQTDEERDKNKSIQPGEELIIPDMEAPEEHNTPDKATATNIRLTMSTPRSGRSHIRALDFSTPAEGAQPRKANTSPKSKTQLEGVSAASATRNLFNNGSDKLEPIPAWSSVLGKDKQKQQDIPIATRTPVSKPTENWDNVNLMFEGGKSGTKRDRSFSESDISPQQVEKRKKSDWDADLRTLVPEVVLPPPKRPRPQKKTPTNKAKRKSGQDAQSKRITRSALKATPPAHEKESSPETTPDATPPEAKTKRKKKEDAEVVDNVINRDRPVKYKKKCNATNILTSSSAVVKAEIVIPKTVFTEKQSSVIPKTALPEKDPIEIPKNDFTDKDPIVIPKDDFTEKQPIPVLETPIKEDFAGIPITPRLVSNNVEDTPLTKLINEQISGMINNFVPTPTALGFTPLIAMTPNIPNYESPYRTRGTDYSSCSSYYVPNDDDERLEQVLITECSKLEDEAQVPSPSPSSSSSSISPDKTVIQVIDSEVTSSVKTELNDKRMRVMDKIKSDTNLQTVKKRGRKKSTPVVAVGPKRGRGRPRKEVPKPIVITVPPASQLGETKSCLNLPKLMEEDDDFPALHISSDEDIKGHENSQLLKQLDAEKRKTPTKSGTVPKPIIPNPEPPEEINPAIEFLNERGIRLVPTKKTPPPVIQPPPHPNIDAIPRKSPRVQKFQPENVILKANEIVSINKENLLTSLTTPPEPKEPSNTIFDCDTITTCIEVVHNPDIKPSQKYYVSDPTQDLGKKFADFEQEYVLDDSVKLLKVTEINHIIVVPEKKQPRVIRRAVKVEKPRPLERLYEEFVKDASDGSNDTISSLCSPDKMCAFEDKHAFSVITRELEAERISEEMREKRWKKENMLEEGECSSSEYENDKARLNEVVSSPEKKHLQSKKPTPNQKVAPKSRTIEPSPSNKQIKSPSKKTKVPQELLMNVDLDLFLTKVHGPTK